MRAAFPTALGDDVDVVVDPLPRAEHPPTTTTIGTIRVAGERLSVPQRVYFPEPGSLPSLTPSQRAILSCIYSRHHDGFVRQRHLERLLDVDEIWVVPFVVQLLGEYVLAIVEVVDGRRDLMQRPTYRAFARENPAFVALTRQRAISYWNCDYRSRFPRKADYPALRWLDGLRPAT